jgi:hypothetical protein
MSDVKTRTLWLLTLPALLVSEALGHAVAARVFDPHDGRHALLWRGVKDYLEVAQGSLAIVIVLAAWVLARRTFSSFRRRRSGSLPAWRLAAVPSGLFLVQEHAERLVHDGDFGWLTAVEPAVAAGVVLQLPCGLLAVWLVRALLRAADGLGSALARRSASARRLMAPRRVRLPRQAALLRLPVVASQHAGRAPPSFA